MTRMVAAGAVAARHLAPREVHTAGVLGTGGQAELQIRPRFETAGCRLLMQTGLR